MAVKSVKGYKTEDGTIFEIDESNPSKALEMAQAHEGNWAFKHWCEGHICVGGEWSAQMVAGTILESWHVVKKV